MDKTRMFILLLVVVLVIVISLTRTATRIPTNIFSSSVTVYQKDDHKCIDTEGWNGSRSENLGIQLIPRQLALKGLWFNVPKIWCVIKCSGTPSLYSIYDINRGCKCDNAFYTMGMVEGRSGQDDIKTTTHEYILNPNYQQTLYTLIGQRKGPKCNCRGTNCTSISCTNLDPSQCWTGLDDRELKVGRQDSECAQDEYGLHSVEPTSSAQRREIINRWTCRKTLDGLLPVSSCQEFSHPEKLSVFHLSTSNETVIIPTVRKPFQGHRVLLMAHMRTGSTFTGQMFEGNEDFFYFFEPLKRMRFMKSMYWHPFKEVIGNKSVAVKLWSDFFKCQFFRTSKATFDVLGSSHKLATYESCHRLSADARLACLQFISARCLNKQSIAYKTIRTDMTEVRQLLSSELPDLKVLYLIRDPRGKLRSESMTKHGATSNQSISDHCNQVIRDVKLGNELSKKYPGQIQFVRYEDVALNVTEASHEVYKKFGMGDLPSDLINYLNNLNNQTKVAQISSNKVARYFSVYRSDNHRAAYSWKKASNIHFFKTIDSLCSQMYELTGYLPASIVELADPTNFHIKYPFTIVG